MTDSTTPQDSAAMPPASTGSVANDSFSAYLEWRDGQIAIGRDDVTPSRVWSAGVRYATLTDAEREAIAYYIGTGGPETVDATLQVLLDRTAL